MNHENEKPTITLTPSGPMIVRGPVEIIGTDGNKIALDPEKLKMGVALCMCGKSKQKPFCDGSHAKM